MLFSKNCPKMCYVWLQQHERRREMDFFTYNSISYWHKAWSHQKKTKMGLVLLILRGRSGRQADIQWFVRSTVCPGGLKPNVVLQIARLPEAVAERWNRCCGCSTGLNLCKRSRGRMLRISVTSTCTFSGNWHEYRFISCFMNWSSCCSLNYIVLFWILISLYFCCPCGRSINLVTSRSRQTKLYREPSDDKLFRTERKR